MFGACIGAVVACRPGEPSHASARDASTPTIESSPLTTPIADHDAELDGAEAPEPFVDKHHKICDRKDVVDMLEAFDHIEKQGFRQAETLEPLTNGDAVQGTSVRWAMRVFSDAADPYGRPHSLAYSFVRPHGIDALRYTFAVDELSMTTIETNPALLVRIEGGIPDLLQGDENAKRERIRDVADRILRTRGTTRVGSGDRTREYRWDLSFAERIVEGALFSTNPDQVFWGMYSWAERVDGGVRGGKLFFLFYKIEPRADGHLAFPSYAWFAPR